MPNQQNQQKKISFFEGALVIGLVVFFDIVQGIGQWVVAFVMAIGSPFLFDSTFGTIAALAVSFATGGAINIAIGLLIGAAFSFSLTWLMGAGIFFFFKRKGVPMVLMYTMLGSAFISELIPYYNTLPFFSGATILMVMSINGLLRKMVEFLLMTFTGGTSSVAVATIEKKLAASAAKKAIEKKVALAGRTQPEQDEQEAETGTRAQRSQMTQIDGIRRATDNSSTEANGGADTLRWQSKVA